jgi:hypothetical protein
MGSCSRWGHTHALSSVTQPGAMRGPDRHAKQAARPFRPARRDGVGQVALQAKLGRTTENRPNAMI